MTSTSTVRVMSPEEIAARAGGETPYLRWPDSSSCFAQREMRLRQLASNHAMGDYLLFMAELAHCQQRCLDNHPFTIVPDSTAIGLATKRGEPPLKATEWTRDPIWHQHARDIANHLIPFAPDGTRPTLTKLGLFTDEQFERQADILVRGLSTGLDLASAPIIGGALQVYWTQMLLTVQRQHKGLGEALGRSDDETRCPCCGSRPTASVTRSSGESLGQRYLHCSLCGLEWHLVRIKCPNCLSEKSLAYHSLTSADHDTESGSDAAMARIQAESCDECDTYLKVAHTDRDAFAEPVADDLASLALDLLMSEAGKQRHGLNYMLLFGHSAETVPPDPDVRRH
ncbi:MAG TPA: formate dehydrogenase accessory protein FdhE [Burkholderiaceae bacterium]|nr:formate dehydrogenase accessory protein FdhE [Burkholderiaceae bacterium]